MKLNDLLALVSLTGAAVLTAFFCMSDVYAADSIADKGVKSTHYAISPVAMKSGIRALR